MARLAFAALAFSTFPLSLEYVDKKVHNKRFQESYCENPAIKSIEPNFLYLNLFSNAYSENEQELKYQRGFNIASKNKINITDSSLNQSAKKYEFTLFPNPAKDEINIKVKDKIEEISYIIYNTSGVIQKEGTLFENKISTQNFQNGNYIICSLNNNSIIDLLNSR